MKAVQLAGHSRPLTGGPDDDLWIGRSWLGALSGPPVIHKSKVLTAHCSPQIQIQKRR